MDILFSVQFSIMFQMISFFWLNRYNSKFTFIKQLIPTKFVIIYFFLLLQVL